MKKYQEALDRFEEAFRNITLNDDLANERRDLLQELVDRATPMKPTKNDKANHDWNRVFCPNCGQWLLFIGAGCANNDCRQKIDWSDEE